jgi:uncharacterized protein (TIGR02246 family)
MTERTGGDRSDETRIRILIEGWARAVRDGDMDGVLAHHTDDVVLFDVPPPPKWEGMAAYRDAWDLFFTYSPGGDGAFDLLDLQIETGDTVAFGHALVRIFDNRVRLSLGLRKVEGQWLIAHEHHSYPSE